MNLMAYKDISVNNTKKVTVPNEKTFDGPFPTIEANVNGNPPIKLH